jgi:hypothetical protein
MPKYWKDEIWATQPKLLIDSIENVYKKAVAAGKIRSKHTVAAKKIVENRRWAGGIDPENLLQAVTDLDISYIPQGLNPGPGFLFPIEDATQEVRRAHIRILDEKLYGLRYISIVNTDEFVGPAWLGTGDDALESIINSGEVTIMEGPFDLLAIRVLEPALPSLCSLTKRLSKQHLDYLRILGVKKINVMFDNEASGRGQQAAETMLEKVKDIEINPVTCPDHDPSDALKSLQKTESLKKVLRSLLPSNLTPVLVPDDDDF